MTRTGHSPTWVYTQWHTTALCSPTRSTFLTLIAESERRRPLHRRRPAGGVGHAQLNPTGPTRRQGRLGSHRHGETGEREDEGWGRRICTGSTRTIRRWGSTSDTGDTCRSRPAEFVCMEKEPSALRSSTQSTSSWRRRRRTPSSTRPISTLRRQRSRGGSISACCSPLPQSRPQCPGGPEARERARRSGSTRRYGPRRDQQRQRSPDVSGRCRRAVPILMQTKACNNSVNI